LCAGHDITKYWVAVQERAEARTSELVACWDAVDAPNSERFLAGRVAHCVITLLDRVR
jgi:hypothetical protein